MMYQGEACGRLSRKHVTAIKTEPHFWRRRKTEASNLDVSIGPGVLMAYSRGFRYVGKTDHDLARQVYREFLTLKEEDIVGSLHDSLEVICHTEDGFIERYFFGKPMRRS